MIIIFFLIRLMLKDALPLSEDHFVIGNTPANLRLGLDIGGTKIDDWKNQPIDCNGSDMSDETTTTSDFIYDYVEVEPIN